ncbi:hypothetical protein ACSVDM_03810 [Nocardia sp. JW2]
MFGTIGVTDARAERAKRFTTAGDALWTDRRPLGCLASSGRVKKGEPDGGGVRLSL